MKNDGGLLNRRGNISTLSIVHGNISTLSSTFTSTYSRIKTNLNIGTFVTTTPKATTVIKPTPKATIDNMIEAIKAVVAKAGIKTVKLHNK